MKTIDKFPTNNTGIDQKICFFDGDLPSFRETVWMKMGARVGRIIADGLYMRRDTLWLHVTGHSDPKLDVELRSCLPRIVKEIEDGVDYFLAGARGVSLPCAGEVR